MLTKKKLCFKKQCNLLTNTQTIGVLKETKSEFSY